MIILDINVSFVALLVWWSYITFILKTISTEFAAVIHSLKFFQWGWSVFTKPFRPKKGCTRYTSETCEVLILQLLALRKRRRDMAGFSFLACTKYFITLFPKMACSIFWRTAFCDCILGVAKSSHRATPIFKGGIDAPKNCKKGVDRRFLGKRGWLARRGGSIPKS